MKAILILIVLLLIILSVEWYDRDDSMVICMLSYNAERVSPGITNECSISSGDSTYTLNKKKIYILLKDDNRNYYNFSTLFYALLHEIAHVLCPDIGHTSMFFYIFNGLLKKAFYLGLYRGNVDRNYCRECVV